MTQTPARLSALTLDRARSTSRPAFDRSATATVTHIGVGAFARAHLGVYADDLSRRGWPTLVRGVSLRNRHTEEQLAPQDCLYTVTEREPGKAAPLRVIGSITSVASGPAAALAALTAPGTTMVTLTITEKGYDLDLEDLTHPQRPTSAPGVVALALARWRESDAAPPVMASLDNVLHNGAVLRSRVLEIAAQLDPALPLWIEEAVAFPSSVVDRMVPATTERDLLGVSSQLGLVDLAAVTTEHHRSWVMTAVEGLPPLEEVGVEFVDDISPFERRKLWLLNGPHSALAYCGLLTGCDTIAAAAAHGTVSAFVERLVDDVLLVADLPPDMQPGTFARQALRRFRNPSLGHTCAQVGADGSRKLPQRFHTVVDARCAAGLNVSRFATVVALWIAAASGLHIGRSVLPAIEDPVGTALRTIGATGDLPRLASVALEGRFDGGFVGGVAQALDRLTREGVGLLEEQA